MFIDYLGKPNATVWIVERWEDFESDVVVGVYATKDAAQRAHPNARDRDEPPRPNDRRHSGFYYYEQEVEGE